MRALILLSSVWALLAACGDNSGLKQPPEVVRKCGELEGVEPVEVVVIGSYPIDLGLGETGSCPMFAPVPCTRPIREYSALCGEECVPQTGTHPNGDTWLVGCAWTMRGMGCTGPDFHVVQCGLDPHRGEPYWLSFRECQPAFLPASYCWEGCDGAEWLWDDPIEVEPAEWCL